jgi:hypothetical protein
MYIPIISYIKSTRKRKKSKMANTKQKIDRWSSSENTVLHLTQPTNTPIPTKELSAVSTMSTSNDSHNYSNVIIMRILDILHSTQILLD